MTGSPTRVLLVCCAVLALVSGCGSSASTTTPSASTSTGPPNLQAFLQLPVASPGRCPAGVNSTTVGRVSPWVGRVDISVYLRPKARSDQIASLGRRLHAQPLVATVYRETQTQAYEEFQRLYTCWSAVAKRRVPSSYRLVLDAGVTTATRNGLVQQLVDMPVVDSVACEPASPCTQIVRSAEPKASAGS